MKFEATAHNKVKVNGKALRNVRNFTINYNSLNPLPMVCIYIEGNNMNPRTSEYETTTLQFYAKEVSIKCKA